MFWSPSLNGFLFLRKLNPQKKKIEKHYEETVVTPLLGVDKLKSRLAPPPAPQPKVETPATPAPTLTQRDSGEPQAKPNVDEMDREQALSFLTKKYLAENKK